jgi:hypothetical protein
MRLVAITVIERLECDKDDLIYLSFLTDSGRSVVAKENVQHGLGLDIVKVEYTNYKVPITFLSENPSKNTVMFTSDSNAEKEIKTKIESEYKPESQKQLKEDLEELAKRTIFEPQPEKDTVLIYTRKGQMRIDRFLIDTGGVKFEFLELENAGDCFRLVYRNSTKSPKL